MTWLSRAWPPWGWGGVQGDGVSSGRRRRARSKARGERASLPDSFRQGGQTGRRARAHSVQQQAVPTCRMVPGQMCDGRIRTMVAWL
eukprot:scaffold11144_cov111-Isochrysis_galbana.AAC.4